MSNPLTLTIFTLNCWGIPWVSKDRAARMDAIASQLSTGKYDIVCLQEVWSNDDYNFISQRVQETLPYSHYFHSGVIGSGICIFSKYPMKDALFHQWSVNGYVHKIQHGDWFGGKGVGLCRLDVHGKAVNVYTAHLHAEYDRNNDEYLAHRVVQAFDTALFIKMTSGPGDIVLVGGDLNTEPQDLAFRIIRDSAQLHDAFETKKNKDKECDGTNESDRNSYSNSKLVEACPGGKRIDYIMYRGAEDMDAKVETFGFPLPPRVPDQNYSYSDHEALMATLWFTPKNKDSNDGISIIEKNVLNDENENPKSGEALEEAVAICNSALSYLQNHKCTYWLLSAVALVALVVFHFVLPFILPEEVNQVTPFISPLLQIVCFLYLLFNIFMATLWNCMEVNGILAGKKAMLVSLQKNVPVLPN